VGEYGPDNAHGGTVAIIDLVRARVSGRIDVGEGTRPHSVWLSCLMAFAQS
jgi:hypothetical protein